MDEKTLYIESKLTAQELKIDRADLSLIEFDTSGRSLARRIGFGFHIVRMEMRNIFRLKTGSARLIPRN